MIRRKLRRFRGSDSGHVRLMANGSVSKVAKNHELVIGKLARMISVQRDEYATLLFGVIETAVRDIAGANPAYAFDEEDFTFNLADARGFLFGHRGNVYFDSLGMDTETARSIIRLHLGPELDAVDAIPPPVESLTLAERIALKAEGVLARGPVSVEDLAFRVGSTRSNTLSALKLMINRGQVAMTHEKKGKGGGRGALPVMYRLIPAQEAA